MGGVLGNEWRSLAGFTLLYRGTTCFSTRPGTHPWGWALACCGRDRDLASDVLQRAYVKVLSGKAKYDGGSAVRTWLFSVIRFTAFDALRQMRRDVRRMDPAALESVVDPATPVDDLLERDDRNARLVTALQKLSQRQREVVQLVFYHDMTIEDAAGVMGVSTGSARTHYDRAKKALARILSPTELEV